MGIDCTRPQHPGPYRDSPGTLLLFGASFGGVAVTFWIALFIPHPGGPPFCRVAVLASFTASFFAFLAATILQGIQEKKHEQATKAWRDWLRREEALSPRARRLPTKCCRVREEDINAEE